MGKEIVYCEGCGQRLHEDEFARGKAQILENRPYCAECRPLTSPPTPRGSEAPPTVPTPSPMGPPSSRKVTTTRIPKPPTPPSTRRSGPPPAKGPKRTVLIATGAGVGLLLVLVVAVASSGGRRDAPAAAPEGTPAGTGGGAPRDPEPDALKQLEQFASTSQDPDAILLRCDQIRPALRGTRWEARLRKVENRALELKAIAERDRTRPHRLDSFMADIRKIVKDDEECVRKVEVLQMLESARKIAGDRLAEVEAFRAEYLKRCEAAEKRPRGAAAPPEREKGPAPAPPAPPPAPAAVQPGADGALVLAAETATRHGPSLLLKGTPGKHYLGDWHTGEDWAEWLAEFPAAGRYRVELTYALEDNCGGEILLTAGPQQIRGRLPVTKDWKKYQTLTLGWVQLPVGRISVAMKAGGAVAGGLMNLRTLKLSPVKGWYELFVAGTSRIAANDYAGAKALYFEGLPSVPADLPADAQQRLVYRTGVYNVACLYGVDARDAKDPAARKAALDEAFRYFERACKSGLQERLCACHADGWAHAAQDRDLESLRGDPRYAELAKQYRK